MRRIFLAGPYGHKDPAVTAARFDEANEVSAKIIRAGAAVFSQISMSHPINGKMSDLDGAEIGKIWAPVDRIFMDAMDEIIVIDGPGWKESSGVAREIAFFQERNRPVHLWSEVRHEFES